jgi:hypothetical protein
MIHVLGQILQLPGLLAAIAIAFVWADRAGARLACWATSQPVHSAAAADGPE